MELASMLAGERFSDRPLAVCPVVGALMRKYNDTVDDALRQDLYRYASECVGTRGDFSLQRRRAVRAIEFASARHAARPLWRRLAGQPWRPEFDDGPEAVAAYVIGSLRRRCAASHSQLLMLLDELLAMTAGPQTGGSMPASSVGPAVTLRRIPSAEDVLVPALSC